MKIKKIIATTCAAAVAMCMAGCGKQQEIVSSTVSESVPQSSVQEESSQSVQEESSQPTQDNNTSEANKDSDVILGSDDFGRVVKVLTFLEKDRSYYSISCLEIEQYNIKADVNISVYNSIDNAKISYYVLEIINISTNMTSQEKAAFIIYWLTPTVYETVENTIKEKGGEDFVIIVNDNKNNPVLIWLAYEKDGKIKHKMEFADIEVVKAAFDVKENSDKWEYNGVGKFYTIFSTPDPTSQPTTSEPTSEPTSTPSVVNPNLVRPEVKEALDAYEALMNEYFDFMKKYNSAADKSSMVMGYLEVLQKYSDAMDKLNAIDDLELTTAENAYYLEVTTRVLARMSESY